MDGSFETDPGKVLLWFGASAGKVSGTLDIITAFSRKIGSVVYFKNKASITAFLTVSSTGYSVEVDELKGFKTALERGPFECVRVTVSTKRKGVVTIEVELLTEGEKAPPPPKMGVEQPRRPTMTAAEYKEQHEGSLLRKVLSWTG